MILFIILIIKKIKSCQKKLKNESRIVVKIINLADATNMGLFGLWPVGEIWAGQAIQKDELLYHDYFYSH